RPFGLRPSRPSRQKGETNPTIAKAMIVYMLDSFLNFSRSFLPREGQPGWVLSSIGKPTSGCRQSRKRNTQCFEGQISDCPNCRSPSRNSVTDENQTKQGQLLKELKVGLKTKG